MVLVIPGLLAVLAAFRPAKEFIRVDLPTLGIPMTMTRRTRRRRTPPPGPVAKVSSLIFLASLLTERLSLQSIAMQARPSCL